MDGHGEAVGSDVDALTQRALVEFSLLCQQPQSGPAKRRSHDARRDEHAREQGTCGKRHWRCPHCSAGLPGSSPVCVSFLSPTPSCLSTQPIEFFVVGWHERFDAGNPHGSGVSWNQVVSRTPAEPGSTGSTRGCPRPDSENRPCLPTAPGPRPRRSLQAKANAMLLRRGGGNLAAHPPEYGEVAERLKAAVC